MGKRKKKSQNILPQTQVGFPHPQVKPASPPVSPTGTQLQPQKKRKGSKSSSPCDTCEPQVSPKLWKRFYEPLVLLSAYGKSQGPHFKSTGDETFCSDDNRDLKKQFLDQLAYVCDYETGGDTVTAIAVEDGPELKYWVAANTDKSSTILPYISSILASLETVFEAPEEHILAVQAQITDRVIQFCSDRLRLYKSRLRSAALGCIKKLQSELTEDAKAVEVWLTSICDQTIELKTLSELCYNARSSTMLAGITRRVEETKQRQNSSHGGKYSKVRHLVGRLGSHIKAVDVLVRVGRHYPRLFQNASVQFETANKKFTPPPYRPKALINDIIKRMVGPDSSLCEYFQTEIGSLDKKFELRLRELIKETYKSPTFKLIVHAEIIIHDLFSRKKLQFLDQVRYIGVSKPSCFLCYRYLQAHPMRVQTSGCSNNLYLQWQPPYIEDESLTLVTEQRDVLNKMNGEIRKFVLDTIVPEYRGHKSHPDSTTGIGTILSIHDTVSKSRTKKVYAQMPPSKLVSGINAFPEKHFDLQSIDTVAELSDTDGGVLLEPQGHYVDSSDDGGVSLFA
ncbi:hypothetical protein TWF970_007221 [Orbilia oligospora]|uniref:Uncharacterized protein n=1 Tax=Orbilia oligospora TaxID=2813651 RepID=A0A7C8RNA4_ORBOL|nr:hypothetical protein TWF970_007221 [Orbilia oligospora]